MGYEGCTDDILREYWGTQGSRATDGVLGANEEVYYS